MGKKFASPIKGKHSRARRARNREVVRQLTELRKSLSPPLSVKSTSASPVVTDACSRSCTTDETFTCRRHLIARCLVRLIVSVGMRLMVL